MRKNIDSFIRNVLIVLVLINLIVLVLNFTNIMYSDRSTESLQSLLNFVNGPVLWIDGILLYMFSLLYIVAAIQSKQEIVLKISFSIFAILTNTMTIVFFVNLVAELFKII